MIAIPHKTLREIDAALSAPNLADIRHSLNNAAKHMRSLEELARQGRQIEIANRLSFDSGSHQ